MKQKSRHQKYFLTGMLIMVFSTKVHAQTFDYADGPLILAGLLIIILLAVLTGLYFSAKKVRIPNLKSYLWGDIKVKVQRINKELVVSIHNQSGKTQEIYAPTMHFTRGRSLKKLQPRDKYSTYPIMLTPGTFHRFKLDPKRMRKQIPELKKIWYFTVVVYNGEGKKTVSRECRFR
ncbi:MAG: hypothetical protein ACOC2F_05555 [Bacteroidota bacterium]